MQLLETAKIGMHFEGGGALNLQDHSSTTFSQGVNPICGLNIFRIGMILGIGENMFPITFEP